MKKLILKTGLKNEIRFPGSRFLRLALNSDIETTLEMMNL